MLSVSSLICGYPSGGKVLDGITFSMEAGEVVALIGRNGMGKSTLLKTLTGHLSPQSGTVEFFGRDIAGAEPHVIANAGIGYVPQGREIFTQFTVEQNLLMGAIGKASIPNQVPPSAYETFPVLAERRLQRAGTLSGGQQQQLAIMRALVGKPELLLLDEPSEGIQPSIVHDISQTLARISREMRLAILLVEQNLELVLSIAQRCLFIENGQIAESIANVSDLRDNPDLIHKYLSV